MKYALLATGLSLAALFGGTANAATTFTSSANSASVLLSVADAIKAGVVLGQVAGTAGNAYDNNNDLLTLNQSVVLIAPTLGNGFLAASEALTAGAVTNHAFSTLPTSVTGAATIADADFGLTSSLAGVPLASLGITADAITSTSTAGVSGGNLFVTGSSSITGLGVALGGLLNTSIDLGLAINAAPNTVLLNLLGIVITLNEQSTTTTATTKTMSTNALHISLTDFLLNGRLLNGDVILGHSFASVTTTGSVVSPVPEPGTWALMIVGFGFVGAMMRTRQRQGSLLLA